MTYKIKSLIYLFCFVAASVLYYNMESEFNPLTSTNSTEVVKVDINITPIENKSEALEIQ